MEKSKKVSVLKKRVGKKTIKGFTLIELMIVIAIIAILASIAIPQYMKYQQKAKVLSYALPIARGCAMDIVSYCVEYPGEDVNPATLPNCNNVTTEGGYVKLYYNNTIQCDANGSICIGSLHLPISGSYFALEYSPNLFNIFRSFIEVPVAFAATNATEIIILPPNILVIAILHGIDSYIAVCEYEKENLKCYVKNMDNMLQQILTN